MHPDNQQAPAAASAWVRKWGPLVPSGGEILDLACGGGRHSRYLASLGYRVCAIDREAPALARLSGVQGIEPVIADLESGPWPLPGRQFDGIVVTNYLHRPLFPHLLSALRTKGLLVYETFAAGNERFGKPSNPDFLLRPGELLEVVRGNLKVMAYEDVQVREPVPAMVQRICALNERPAGPIQLGNRLESGFAPEES